MSWIIKNMILSFSVKGMFPPVRDNQSPQGSSSESQQSSHGYLFTKRNPSISNIATIFIQLLLEMEDVIQYQNVYRSHGGSGSCHQKYIG